MAEAGLRLAVVGLGHWGEKLARAFGSVGRAEVSAVCDVALAARTRAAEVVPRADVAGSMSELLARGGVSAAIIATPPATHAELGLSALEAGLDVFLEKPMSLTLDDACALERAAARAGRRLMVGHILEYHPAIVALSGMIRRGELGAIRLIVSERLGPSVSRHESVWWSLGPHDVSVMRFLTGVEPTRVSVAGTDDVVAARIDAPNGMVALAHLSFDCPEKVRRTVVVGSEGVAVFDDAEGASLELF